MKPIYNPTLTCKYSLQIDPVYLDNYIRAEFGPDAYPVGDRGNRRNKFLNRKRKSCTIFKGKTMSDCCNFAARVTTMIKELPNSKSGIPLFRISKLR